MRTRARTPTTAGEGDQGHPSGAVQHRRSADEVADEGATEVSYLLQAQKRHAAHYTRQVKGPGVGSIVKAGDRWYLFFAGYRPSERAHDGEYKSKHRTPFSLRLKVSVRPKSPAHPLHSISRRELRRWIVPKR